MVCNKIPEPNYGCGDPEIGDLFLFYLNEDVTLEQRRRIEAHVSNCPECQEELRFFATIKLAKPIIGNARNSS